MCVVGLIILLYGDSLTEQTRAATAAAGGGQGWTQINADGSR